MEKINDKNYELWLVRYADAELTAAERQQVEQWLAAHPEASEELKLYMDAPRIESDSTVTCENEEQYLQSSHSAWKPVVRWAAAAAVVAMLVVPATRIFAPERGEEEIEVAQTQLPIHQTPIILTDTIEPNMLPQPMIIRNTKQMAEVVAEEIAIEEEMPADIEADDTTIDASPASIPLHQEPELIAFEAVAPDGTILVDNLIVVDTISGWEQLLYSANDVLHYSIGQLPAGNKLSQGLPSNETLSSRVVEPLQNLREQGKQRTTPKWLNNGLKIVKTITNTVNQ